MKTLNTLLSGATRSLKAWKWVIIIWLCSLFLVSLLAFPMRAGLRSVLGSSMITEKLSDGINIDVLADFGTNLSTILSSLTFGFFIVVFLGLLMNIFLCGGLFSSLKSSENKVTASQFFGGAGANFWSFLVIVLLMMLIILFLGFLIIGIPQIIVRSSDTVSEATPVITGKIAAIIFLLILPVFLLVTDYARAWQAASSESACFKAIGNGFRQTFKHFFSSYFVMAIVLVVQILFGWLIFSIIPGWRPSSGGGVFLLFLLSQILFISKLILRAWRYGSVTSMLEQHP
jgi:hypothetical protein